MPGTVPGAVAPGLPETAGFDHSVEGRVQDSSRSESVLIAISVSVDRLESPVLGGVDWSRQLVCRRIGLARWAWLIKRRGTSSLLRRSGQMNRALNRAIAIGILVLVMAAISVVAGVLWSQDNEDQAAVPEANSNNSRPTLDPQAVQQIPMSNAADRIHGLRIEAGLSGFTGMRFDNDKNELVLYWKGGNLPPEMSTLVDEIRAEVPVQVVNSPYSLEEFDAEARRLIQLPTIDGVDVIEAGPTGDFSGIRVGIATNDDRTDARKIETARQAIKSNFPLDFTVAGKLIPY